MPAFPIDSRSVWRPTALSRVVPAAASSLVIAAILTALAAALVWNPLLVLVAVPITLGWVGGVAFGPLVFLCFVAATAGFGFTWVQGLGLTIAGRPVNPSGLHWGITFGIAAMLVARAHAGPLPKLFRPYAALAMLAMVG